MGLVFDASKARGEDLGEATEVFEKQAKTLFKQAKGLGFELVITPVVFMGEGHVRAFRENGEKNNPPLAVNNIKGLLDVFEGMESVDGPSQICKSLKELKDTQHVFDSVLVITSSVSGGRGEGRLRAESPKDTFESLQGLAGAFTKEYSDDPVPIVTMLHNTHATDEGFDPNALRILSHAGVGNPKYFPVPYDTPIEFDPLKSKGTGAYMAAGGGGAALPRWVLPVTLIGAVGFGLSQCLFDQDINDAPDEPEYVEPAPDFTDRFDDGVLTFSGDDIQFDKGSAVIKAESQPVIDQYAQYLSENPDNIYSLHFVGHASPEGDARVNMDLSKDRARAVVTALQEHPDYDISIRMQAIGCGEEIPKYTAQGLQDFLASRRVEVFQNNDWGFDPKCEYAQ